MEGKIYSHSGKFAERAKLFSEKRRFCDFWAIAKVVQNLSRPYIAPPTLKISWKSV